MHNTEVLSLPVPLIRDESMSQHSYKQKQRRYDTNRLRPPKMKRYDNNFNRSQCSATAHAISFRGDGEEDTSEVDTLPLGASYDRSKDETYFEQTFTRLEKIGEGSFGKVFKVRSKVDGLMYAVKMSKHLFRGESYRQERLEEVRRYEQFSGHANCVRFYRAWEQDHRLYMQMELCRENLECYVERRRPIPEEKIWSILLDLLLALKSLHDRNLIHLDIKLDNVLIGDDDSCKLADFGLVIDVDRANRHQATEGDSRYIAPEIMQGKFSKAADIFSLGIAMLELSTDLELPPNGPLWQELRSGILPQDFVKTMPLDLLAIIKQMMTPDPLARPTVDQLLSHKRLVTMLQCRNRWQMIIKFKQTIRESRRMACSQLCNLKNILLHFFTLLTAKLQLMKPFVGKTTQSDENGTTQCGSNRKQPTLYTNIIASTPVIKLRTCSDFVMDENCFEPTQQSTPTNFDAINSTPLNRGQHSFRSRKDLTKTSFCTVEGMEPTANDKPPSSFLSLDDIETHSHSFIRQPLDTSSLRGKKLFSKNDDSD